MDVLIYNPNFCPFLVTSLYWLFWIFGAFVLLDRYVSFKPTNSLFDNLILITEQLKFTFLESNQKLSELLNSLYTFHLANLVKKFSLEHVNEKEWRNEDERRFKEKKDDVDIS